MLSAVCGGGYGAPKGVRVRDVERDLDAVEASKGYQRRHIKSTLSQHGGHWDEVLVVLELAMNSREQGVYRR